MKLTLSSRIILYISVVTPCFAMHTNEKLMYVRFVDHTNAEEGVLKSFPKKLLPYLHTLVNMLEDLPAYGTLENPIILGNIRPEEFQEVIRLLSNLEPILANPYAHISPNQLWLIFGFNKDRYALLAQLIRAGDFLDIDQRVAEALKHYISMPPRDLELKAEGGPWSKYRFDRVLQADLRPIDALSEQILIPIKEDLIRKIRAYIENKLIAVANDPNTKHEKTIQSILAASASFSACEIRRVLYNPHNFDFYVQCKRSDNQFALFLFEQTNAGLKWKPFGPFPYKFMREVPNQSIFPTIFSERGLDVATLQCPYAKNSIHIIFTTDNSIRVTSFYATLAINNPNALIMGISLFGDSKKTLVIPDVISFIDTYKDQQGATKLVCVAENGGDNNRILTVDFEKNAVTILKTFDDPIYYIRGTVVVGSKLICSCDGYHDNKFFITVDLHTKEITIDADPHEAYEHLLAAPLKGNSIQLSGTVALNVDTYQFDIVDNKPHITSMARTSYPFAFLIASCESLPSKICVINIDHPEIEDLIQPTVLDVNNSIYIVGLLEETNQLYTFKWFDKAAAANIMQQINNFTQLSIKQLYLLEELCYYQTLDPKPTTITPSQLQLFETLPTNDQQLFYTLFSKEFFTTPFEATAIIIPEKTGTVEAPLPGYIMPGQGGGSKRTAPETPRKSRRAKKRKLEQGAISGGESESSSEATFNESEEEKE